MSFDPILIPYFQGRMLKASKAVAFFLLILLSEFFFKSRPLNFYLITFKWNIPLYLYMRKFQLYVCFCVNELIWNLNSLWLLLRIKRVNAKVTAFKNKKHWIFIKIQKEKSGAGRILQLNYIWNKKKLQPVSETSLQ